MEVDLPEQPELITFKFTQRCKAFTMPGGGTIAVVGPDLQLHLLNQADYDQHPDPEYWVRILHKQHIRRPVPFGN